MDNHKFKDRGGIEEGKCRTPKIFWYHCHSIDKTEDTKMVYKIKCASGILWSKTLLYTTQTQLHHYNFWSRLTVYFSSSNATADTLAVVGWHFRTRDTNRVRLLLRTTMTWPIMDNSGTNREVRALSKEMVVIIQVRLAKV